ncbi:MAG: hypothetical protein ACK55Z_28535, partial [bacterium]
MIHVACRRPSALMLYVWATSLLTTVCSDSVPRSQRRFRLLIPCGVLMKTRFPWGLVAAPAAGMTASTSTILHAVAPLACNGSGSSSLVGSASDPTPLSSSWGSGI